MPTPATNAKWDKFCDATYPSRCLPLQPAPDLVDFTLSLAALRLEAQVIERVMLDADECGAARGPTLRAHLGELRLLASYAAALVAEAEREAA